MLNLKNFSKIIFFFFFQPTDFKFEYPDFTGDKSAKEEMKSYKNFKEQHKVSKSNEKIDKSGVPTWFHY